MDINGSGTAVVFVPPHPAEEGLSIEYTTGVRSQKLEELVFHEGQVEGRVIDRSLVGIDIYR